MPELPEVETVVRGLAPLLVGRRFEEVQVRRADLRWPVPSDLVPRLSGARVLAVARRAKYGLITTDRGDTLLFHLGMSGRFRIDPGTAALHDHLLFRVGGRWLAYHDPRRFGSFHLVASSEANRHPLLASLGPEPLTPGFDGALLAAAAQGRQASIKALVLDQRVVAGIGNIYACEGLFRAGIRPTRAGHAVGRARLDRLARALVEVLGQAIAAGGSTLRDHAAVSGELGYFQHRFAVYGRAGEPCLTCATRVRRIVQQGRSTFFCPRCQR
jgi:formamidopyrimidine-DNA glycosylase